MGSPDAEVEEISLNPSGIKVHRAMCSQILNSVVRVSNLFPDIEAAQPRCTSGIQALCLLQNAIKKAQLLVQYCSESSKLYLAITGDAILSRCQRTNNLLEQSLSQLQTMVPVTLESKISEIIEGLRRAVFIIDSSEEEAGRVVRALLQQCSSGSESATCSEIEAIQIAASRLHLKSQKDLLIERRSIKKLLNEVTASDQTKKKILKYLLYLLKKYAKLILGEQTDDPSVQQNGSFSVAKSHNKLVEGQLLDVESRLGCAKDGAQQDMLRVPLPPKEFNCPISLRLMYDPVVIASGQTFERMYIQRWFDEGHDTCPRTRMKLPNFSMTPNTAMRDLVSKWCTEHGITIFDPVFSSLETSSNSICSTSSSLKGLHLQIDLSNASVGSLDTSYSSDLSHSKFEDGMNLIKLEKSHRFQYFSSVQDIEEEFLLNFSTLPWESQCMAIEDVNSYLKCYNGACAFISSANFVEPLFGFLNDALEKRDIKAQKAGARLFLTYLATSRAETLYVSEDMCTLLASFLETEAAEETLAILVFLTGQDNCGSKLAACGALASILKILDAQNRDIHEAAINILYNLSLKIDVHSNSLPLECIPKLLPFLSDVSLAGRCIVILKNLCDIEAGRSYVAQTKGCISAIAELLDVGSREDQENAVSILLSLCSQCVQYCRLVMNEGIIPSLVSVSNSGNDRGKIIAWELLRLLRDVDYEEQNCSVFDINVISDSYERPEEKSLSSKRTGFFQKKLASLAKPSFLFRGRIKANGSLLSGLVGISCH
ncbi:hypothetical protein Nepgr_008163 [Nepenthes gracilis]|uniref:RING-type E3 ubiquitin transferase n=1 Tax=Nepenthes gracilis TaxID=150966 RepID=A0AAD3S8H1_NEPGR|nr:hypothetical protein Nepgr_008163 [Nepenthes gracilis]